jgi:hypothetical protein
MSYSDYLRTKQINSPKIIDVRQHYGDTSTYTWNKKLATSVVSRPSDHVISNQSDPFLPTPSNVKQPTSYSGKQGGRVQDTSMYTLSLGARSIAQDKFSPVKIVQSFGCTGATPAASLIINQNGNFDGSKSGLNMGDVLNKCPSVYNPLTKSCFVDTIPALQTHKIDSLVGCTTTMTSGNWGPKDEKSPQISKRPPKTDFVTSPIGPQISEYGSPGRAPKVGAALRNIPYVEGHHGNVQVNLPVYSGFKPTTGAPAQLKINSPQHYPVA